MRRSLPNAFPRRYHAAVRLLGLAILCLLSTSAAALPRVYLTPLRAPNVDTATTDLLAEQLLVSARRHKELYEVVGAADVKAFLDVEAASAALGCDTESCANEVADALAADQLLAGQLGHIGGVWLLTLTRTDRKTLQVLSRASVEAHGDSPEVLLPEIPHVVDAVLELQRPPNFWLWGGGVVAGTGLVPLVGGAVLYALSLERFQDAKDALTDAPQNVETARQAESESRALYTGALIAAITGGALIVIGGVTMVVAAATEGE